MTLLRARAGICLLTSTDPTIPAKPQLLFLHKGSDSPEKLGSPAECRLVGGLLWHSGFGPNLAQCWSKRNVFLQNGFDAQLYDSTGKLLTYDTFCTPKATVMHVFINMKFCQTGVKSNHPKGIKTSDKGYFFGLGYLISKNCP